ncbi:sensor histidine kinase [Haloarchaeobius sp. TZWWS8]|uniref:sensor histidine kinase n=1 Tax=Haloarchaeobius sp. TZWWS8 TaxID=3446121 RepID=UPI003EC00283
MGFVDVLFAALLVSAAVSTGITAYILLLLRGTARVRSAAEFAVVSGSAAVWAFAYSLQLTSSPEQGKFLWAVVVWFAITVMSVAWPVFALTYTGYRDYVTRKSIAALSVVPVVTFVLVLTGQGHELAFRNVELVTVDGYSLVEATPGPVLLLFVVYTILLDLLAVVVLARLYVGSRGQTRRQAGAVLVAGLFPFAVSIASLFATGALYGVNLTPVAFSVSVLIIGLALSRFGLFRLVPVARDRLLEELDDCVLVLDPDSVVVDGNRSARELFGAGIRGSELETPFPDWETALDEALSLDLPIEVDHPDGRVFEVTAMRLTTTDERSTGTLVVLSDVTQRIERERQLEAMNQQLDQFAGLVSHDLRNPVSVARGHAELLAEEMEHDSLDAIRESTERMEEIIEDALSLARSKQGTMDPYGVDLRSAALEAWETVDTDVAVLAVETSRHIEADRSRLLTVLENLYRNAVEHGSTGDQTASSDTVEPERLSGAGRSTSGANGSDDGDRADRPIRVTVGDLPDGFFVEDDGIGIPETARGQVFEAGNTSRTDGTGLGLAIVEQAAEAHGWSVSLVEGTDGGARFEFAGVTSYDDRE